MRLFSWNYRGLGKPSAVLQCKKKALDYKPDILFLMETKLAKNKGKEIWMECGFSKGVEVPRVGLSGGLLLMWLPNVNLRVIHATPNFIHADLVDNKGSPLSIAFIYGYPKLAKKGEVW